ncbi:pseudaminic acid synthase [Curvibacter sp. APW13]|uniref:pseudaminic acid synthase n=1 Tax=Curvibacter sp. APW13 TaxID=3077236 RepID=UPI0028DEE035|nr:pseudaminic acid synthase [Curvibacter sp. APW13]MDT8993099.1 pseudaminic acid synthase [Curvibacter sp. APW13]
MIEIQGKRMGAGAPVFIVAEMSANHLHSLDKALELVDQAAAAGADGFKIQTLTPEAMTIDCDNEYFVINSGTPWDGKKLIDLYSETPFPYEWHAPIFERCSHKGLICFSTPYDISAADFLRQFDPPMYKIASFEIFDTPLIRHVASFGKPMVISTGMAEYDDIKAAVHACRSVGNENVLLLKCTSAYPAPLEEINLLTMAHMQKEFGVMVGVSDHTLGHEVSLASVTLGGCFIEKHFTLDRALGGPDASFSIEPGELTELVDLVRNTERLLGKIDYSVTEKAKANKIFARSLFFVNGIKAGERVTPHHIRSIRPGFGLKPSEIDQVLGKRVKRDIARGTPTSWDQFDE